MSRRRQAAGFALETLGRPHTWRGVARRLTRTLLECRFDVHADAAPLPEALAAAIASAPVELPPRRLFSPGNQQLEGLVWLVSLARAVDARTIFEIGTYNGLTAYTLARNLPEASIHTLDLPPARQPRLELFGFDYVHLPTGGRRVYEGTPEAERIVQHLEDSADFDFAPFAGAVDLVYVDGAHSLPYVTSDSRAALELVSATGLVVWDDYDPYTPAVAEALSSLGLRPLYRIEGTRLAVWLTEGASGQIACRAELQEPVAASEPAE